MRDGIDAVAFDCYGTLVDFGDDAFRDAYALICAEQGLTVDGQAFYDKWLEVWRRLARGPSTGSGRGGAMEGLGADAVLNRPAPLSETEPVLSHAEGVTPPPPQPHTPAAGRSRSLDGPLPPFRSYREEWPEHFAICFEELGVRGDAKRAHERLVGLMARAGALPGAGRRRRRRRAPPAGRRPLQRRRRLPPRRPREERTLPAAGRLVRVRARLQAARRHLPPAQRAARPAAGAHPLRRRQPPGGRSEEHTS